MYFYGAYIKALDESQQPPQTLLLVRWTIAASIYYGFSYNWPIHSQGDLDLGKRYQV